MKKKSFIKTFSVTIRDTQESGIILMGGLNFLICSDIHLLGKNLRK